MKLNINEKHLIELYKKGLSVDQVVLLGFIKDGYNVDDLINSSLKIESLYFSLCKAFFIKRGLHTNITND